LIARDELQHLALVQHILKTLPQDDSEFIQIIGDNRNKASQIFQSAVDQEKDWAHYLFRDGSMLGLNADILCDSVDYFASKARRRNGLSSNTTKLNHPIPWIEKHLTSHNTQVAPQETEISSYVTGAVKNDISNIDFSKMWEL
jgi:ribonucleoside-diphosphate reductase beta chain